MLHCREGWTVASPWDKAWNRVSETQGSVWTWEGSHWAHGQWVFEHIWLHRCGWPRSFWQLNLAESIFDSSYLSVWLEWGPSLPVFMFKAGNTSFPFSLPHLFPQSKQALASSSVAYIHIYIHTVALLGQGVQLKSVISKLLYKYSLEVYSTLHWDVCSILFQGNVTPAQNNNLHPRFHGSKENRLNCMPGL